MSRVQAYLDCGCAIMEGGGRAWCPTCLDGAGKTPIVDKTELTALRELLRRCDVLLGVLRSYTLTSGRDGMLTPTETTSGLEALRAEIMSVLKEAP